MLVILIFYNGFADVFAVDIYVYDLYLSAGTNIADVQVLVIYGYVVYFVSVDVVQFFDGYIIQYRIVITTVD